MGTQLASTKAGAEAPDADHMGAESVGAREAVAVVGKGRRRAAAKYQYAPGLGTVAERHWVPEAVAAESRPPPQVGGNCAGPPIPLIPSVSTWAAQPRDALRLLAGVPHCHDLSQASSSISALGLARGPDTRLLCLPDVGGG